MRARGERHGRWRDLIAARFDRPLTRVELRSLSTHLKSCPACQQVERDYHEQRRRLRSLPHPIPPRDLWARTSTALDREVARGSYRRPSLGGPFGAGGQPVTPSAALITTMAALGVVAAISVMQLLPAAQPAPPPAAGLATPFAVDPQQLAFVGHDAADTYVYQTSVSHVCPQSAPDCKIDEGIIRTPVGLPPSMRARNVALSPSGRQLALVGRDVDRDMIAVVMLPEDDPISEPATSAPGAVTDASPSADAPPTMVTPNGTEGPPASDPNVTSAPDTPAPASPAESAAPTDSPASELPTATGTDAPTMPAATSTTPPASAVPGLRVLAILENVHSAGAPPAWSASGEMLAFSAMPADGSHGPDVYVWAPTDEHARAITSDHSSFFASWSGDRIVASRVADSADQPNVHTVVIDPLTLEERRVDGPALWLPVVNPARSHAVAWHGQLEWNGALPSPRTGTLYMVEWDVLDPFATDQADLPPSAPEQSLEPSAQPTASPSVEPTPSPPATDVASPTAAPSTTAAPSPTAAPSTTAAPSLTGAAGDKPEDRVEDRPEQSATPSSAAPPSPTPPFETARPTADLSEAMVALDIGRDPNSAPVVDWQVRWSSDGQVLGVWIADAPGTTWGRLLVVAIDAQSHQVNPGDPLLPPTLARRGFTLGHSRVAWVAPSEDNLEGELRIRTWSDDGVGGLRLQPAELEEVMPAF